jgi:16S rRNA (cytosine1402-N4)-methyltransferase
MDESPSSPPRRRRPRYAGKFPRRFEDKYKERDPLRYPETVDKVLASGKTPAGTHRPIMVDEILEVLSPRPGETAVDCTLGHGGHAEHILPRLLPGGKLIGLDADPVELARAEQRLRTLGFGADVLAIYRTNFAGLPQVLARAGLSGADVILADLGVSSMQLDDPQRGFSMKTEGPLDMRLNQQRGEPASTLVSKSTPVKLQTILEENADEPRAKVLSEKLAGCSFATTSALVGAIRAALPRMGQDEQSASVRRVFQALRIAVNDEFSALEALLRWLPGCLNPGGRAAILTFHSGEDRRVKKAFAAGVHAGQYSEIAEQVVRPSPTERYANPRSASAKLRWARKAGLS